MQQPWSQKGYKGSLRHSSWCLHVAVCHLKATSQIRPSCLVFQHANRLQEHKGLQKCQRPGCLQALSCTGSVSEQQVVWHCHVRLVHHSGLKSEWICVRERTDQTVLNKLGVGGVRVSTLVGGQFQKKSCEVFSSLSLLSLSSPWPRIKSNEVAK